MQTVAVGLDNLLRLLHYRILLTLMGGADRQAGLRMFKKQALGSTFEVDFSVLTGHAPMRWQAKLFERFAAVGDLPRALDLPTGLGKTSVMAIWYLAFKAVAGLPRRLVYVVDRRAVVDQATEVAEKIRAKSGDPALSVSTVRGQYVDNRDWLKDPAASAIIVGTVDMIGSRLLFEGYGVSRKMRPYQAGFLGADTLVILDESHLVPPFERLLDQISEREDLKPRQERDRRLIPTFRLLALSATGRDAGGDVFRLTEEDFQDPIVVQRLGAPKRLASEPAADRNLADPLAQAAWKLADSGRLPVRILVYCDKRETAEKTKAAIETLAKGDKTAIDIELFVGARRVKERVDAAITLQKLGFLAGSREKVEKTAFLIATSAGEVGVDLDADHMVCDLVPWERMVQRFGRVNRLGNGEAKISLITEPPKPTKSEQQALEKRKKEGQDRLEDKEKKLIVEFEARGEAVCRLKAPFDHLPKHGDEIDVSPGALRDLKLRAGTDPLLRQILDAATTPEPLYPALTRPLVDAWAMTSLDEHTGRPEVQPWLRGWMEDDPPQTTVVWRKYLPVREQGGEATRKDIEDFFEAAPPHLSEKLETETWRVVEWLMARAGAVSKDGQLSTNTIVALALAPDGSLHKIYTFADLVESQTDKKRKDSLRDELPGLAVVVDARLSGLKDGLLDRKADNSAASAADSENGWFDPSTGTPLAPFRVRRVIVGEKDERSSTEDEATWRPVYAFDAERDAEANPIVQFLVEKWRGADSNEDGRSVSARAQNLAEHQEWAADQAKRIVETLCLPEDIAQAIVLAARLHDEGKKAARWQNAFHTPTNDRPYAKTGSKRPPDFDILGGYRHEFGSLLRAEKNNALGALPDDLKDLVLHLIAAHHGRARPVIETEGCDDGPPSLLQARARDVALRFARLQKRFGPWGLAWLEALVRAADQRASRALENEGRSNG